MWQRIQTLYMALGAVMFFFVGYNNLSNAQSLLAGLGVALLLANITYYKHRKRQFMVNRVVVIVAFVLEGWLICGSMGLVEGATSVSGFSVSSSAGPSAVSGARAREGFNSAAGVTTVSLAGIGNVVGGLNPGQRNVISGNRLGGAQLSTSAVIQGNYIGTNAAGTAALGNGGHGISIFVSATSPT